MLLSFFKRRARRRERGSVFTPPGSSIVWSSSSDLFSPSHSSSPSSFSDPFIFSFSNRRGSSLHIEHSSSLSKKALAIDFSFWSSVSRITHSPKKGSSATWRIGKKKYYPIPFFKLWSLRKQREIIGCPSDSIEGIPAPPKRITPALG